MPMVRIDKNIWNSLRDWVKFTIGIDQLKDASIIKEGCTCFIGSPATGANDR